MIGIYKITNPKGKIYIGQATDLKKREEKYKRLNCKKQPKIFNSLKFYGWEAHQFEIIEECTLEQLDEKEAYYKQHFINEFGWSKALFCHLVDGKGGYKSEETKNKISESLIKGNHPQYYTEEVRNKIGNPQKGKQKNYKDKKQRSENLSKALKGKLKPEGFGEKLSKLNKGRINLGKKSQEIKDKISNSSKGRKNTQEHKDKISLSTSKIVNIKCLENNIVYKNVKEVSQKLNISETLVRLACNKGIKAKEYTLKCIK